MSPIKKVNLVNRVEKSPHLSVAVTKDELRLWRRAAKNDKRSLSSWVRVTLDEKTRATLTLEEKVKRMAR